MHREGAIVARLRSLRTGRIDGIVALIMALSRAMGDTSSVYDQRGILFIY